MEREEIVSRARLVGQQRNYIEREVERMMLSMLDLNNSLTTIAQMKEEQGLVPVGGGAFIKARLEAKKVYIPVGANYIMEYDAEGAKKEIDARMKMTEAAIQNLRNELRKADEEFARLEKAYREKGGRAHEEAG
ncbi:MAG: prefoldin subunit alpha [Candidatus Micrarchaeota archaeon]